MKKVISILALSVTSANSQAIFTDQLRIESAQTNLQSQSPSLIPSYRSGRFGMDH